MAIDVTKAEFVTSSGSLIVLAMSDAGDPRLKVQWYDTANAAVGPSIGFIPRDGESDNYNTTFFVPNIPDGMDAVIVVSPIAGPNVEPVAVVP